LVLLTPRCGAIPLALPPGQAGGDDGDHGARAAACDNAGNGDPLGNNDAAAAAAVTSKADDMGQENDDCSSDNGDNDENNNNWGRGA
jgi:hypothetical protein